MSREVWGRLQELPRCKPFRAVVSTAEVRNDPPENCPKQGPQPRGRLGPNSQPCPRKTPNLPQGPLSTLLPVAREPYCVKDQRDLRGHKEIQPRPGDVFHLPSWTYPRSLKAPQRRVGLTPSRAGSPALDRGLTHSSWRAGESLLKGLFTRCRWS